MSEFCYPSREDEDDCDYERHMEDEYDFYYERYSESEEEDYCDSDDNDIEKEGLSEKQARMKGFRGRQRQDCSRIHEKRPSMRPSKRSGKKKHTPFKVGSSHLSVVPNSVDTCSGTGSGKSSGFHNPICHYVKVAITQQRKENREKALYIIAFFVKKKLGCIPMGRILDVSTIVSYIDDTHKDLYWFETTNLKVMKKIVYEFMKIVEWSYNDNCGKASQYYTVSGNMIENNFARLVHSIKYTIYSGLEWMWGPLNMRLFIKNRVLHRLSAMYVVRELHCRCPGIDCFLPEFLKPVIGSPFGVCARKYEFESPFQFTDSLSDSLLVVPFDEHSFRRIQDAKVYQDEIERMTLRLKTCRKSL